MRRVNKKLVNNIPYGHHFVDSLLCKFCGRGWFLQQDDPIPCVDHASDE